MTGRVGPAPGSGSWQQRWIAHALLRRGSDWLLLRRSRGRYLGECWDVPGGTVEPGETPALAARREVLEETGSRVEIGAVLSHYANEDTGGRPIRFHTVTFRAVEADPSAPVVLSDHEHDRFEWSGTDEALGTRLGWHVRRTLSRIAAHGG